MTSSFKHAEEIHANPWNDRHVKYAFPAAIYALASIACGAIALAQTAPSPSPAASRLEDAAASDPCGGDTRLLATLDRPTIGYSVCAVAPGTIIFEDGYQVQENGTNDVSSSYVISYPQNFMRIGIKPRLELDLIGPYFNKTATPDRIGGLIRTHGYQDGGLGFKYELPPAAKYTIAIDGLYTSPNGSTSYTAGGATETLNLDVAYAITPALGLGTTIAFSSTSGVTGGVRSRYNLLAPSFVATVQLNNAYQLYAEYVYVSKLGLDQGGRAFIDYGVQKLLGRNVELDVESGTSLIGDQSKKFHYFGFGLGLQLH